MRASRWWSADPMTSITDAPQNPLPFNSARSRKVPGGRVVRWLGACWAVIPEKYRFILFGTYPFSEQWRPALVCLTFIALFYVSSRRNWWRTELVAVWAAALALIGVLMWG